MPTVLKCGEKILAGVPGVARDDRWRNPIAFFPSVTKKRGDAVAQLVEALRYKSEGREFES